MFSQPGPNTGKTSPAASVRELHAPSVPSAPPALMTLRDIVAYTQIGLRTLYRWKSCGKFPGPDLVEGKVHRWRRETVDAWICPDCKQHASRWGRAEE
jgi:predicted DNA-binding transcriptional regulator AlpA